MNLYREASHDMAYFDAEKRNILWFALDNAPDMGEIDFFPA